MKNYFTAPLALALLAFSLAGCVYFPHHGWYGHRGYGHGGNGYGHDGYGH
jgi:hypothetical protein